MAGAHTPGAPTPTSTDQMNSEQVMLPQLQTSHAVNADLTGLNQQQDDVTPLTPQDQLSRFVENL